MVEELAALPSVTVGIISGRPRELVEDLPMPRDEQIARGAALRDIVWSDTATAWARTFLDSLKP